MRSSGAKNASSSSSRCVSAGSAVTMAVSACRPACGLREAGQQQRIGRAGGAGQREAFAGGDVGQVHERQSKSPREVFPRGE